MDMLQLPLCETYTIYDETKALDFNAGDDVNYTDVAYNDSYYADYRPPGNVTGGGDDVTHTRWFEVVIPIISVIGIVGNILNLILLTRRRLLSSMERLERSATYGLVALALSDMCFCVCIFPHMFISSVTYRAGVATWVKGAELCYRVYGIALINLFMMISTWLIMFISVTRYFVVIKPIQMRSWLNGSKTVVSIVTVFLASILISLPQFMHLKVTRCQTLDEVVMFEILPLSDVTMVTTVRFYIRWIWPILADFIPVLVLAFCNARLITELNRASSHRRRALTNTTATAKDSGHKVNLTLISIVLMLLLLVTPPEILKYINPYKAWGHVGYVIANVANSLQALSFAINFFLYVVLNQHFRQTMWDLFCTWCAQGGDTAGGSRFGDSLSKYPLNGYSPRSTRTTSCRTKEETFL